MSAKRSPPTEEDIAYFCRIVENSKRLAEDCRLLIEAKRAKSAVMVGILAIEEFGKALIVSWETRNRANKRAHPSHIEKQAATFSLLAAAEAVRMPRKLLATKLGRTPNLNNIGPDSAQLAQARSGFYDKIRMHVTYEDKDALIPAIQASESLYFGLAAELLEIRARAEGETANHKAMMFAAMMFENDFGRL